MDRQNRLRKDISENESQSPPKMPLNEELHGQAQRTGSDTPTPPSQFEIGDDDDSEDEVKHKNQSSAASSGAVASPPRKSRNPSLSSSVEDAVPLQLRGMSEKARGKLPEGSFQRQGSTTSLASHISTNSPGTSATGFTPSAAWVGRISLFTLYNVLRVL